MARKRRTRQAKAEMNVVPYIDVMLVLLVIFMISAPLLNQSVEVDLPSSENSKEIDADSEAGETKPPFVVSIKENGTFFVERAGEEDFPITKNMVADFAAQAKSDNPNVSMYIRADKLVNYGQVMIIMDVLKNTGAESVGLITEVMEE